MSKLKLCRVNGSKRLLSGLDIAALQNSGMSVKVLRKATVAEIKKVDLAKLE